MAYVEGTGQSCLVRGFWGDIVISPYPTLALEVDSYPENERLLNKRNELYTHVGSCNQAARSTCS